MSCWPGRILDYARPSKICVNFSEIQPKPLLQFMKMELKTSKDSIYSALTNHLGFWKVFGTFCRTSSLAYKNCSESNFLIALLESWMRTKLPLQYWYCWENVIFQYHMSTKRESDECRSQNDLATKKELSLWEGKSKNAYFFLRQSVLYFMSWLHRAKWLLHHNILVVRSLSHLIRCIRP